MNTSTFILIMAAAVFVMLAIGLSEHNKKQAELAAQVTQAAAAALDTLRAELAYQGFKISRELYFENTLVAIDSKRLKLAICDTSNPQVSGIFHASQLVTAEVVEDGTVTASTGAIGRAIVGAVVAGPAGAIVGASTSDRVRKIHEMTVLLHTKNIDKPLFPVPVFKVQYSPVESSSPRYGAASIFARELIATVQNLVRAS